MTKSELEREVEKLRSQIKSVRPLIEAVSDGSGMVEKSLRLWLDETNEKSPSDANLKGH